MGCEEAFELLDATLDEEKVADEMLTEIAGGERERRRPLAKNKLLVGIFHELAWRKL